MSYVDDLHLPQVPSVLTREIAGIDHPTLKNWIVHKPPAVLLTEAERAEADQRTRFAFSINRVTQIALTAEWVRLGFSPRAGALLAAGFTDAEVGPLPGEADRAIGELFPTGQTLLVAYPGLEIGHVVNAAPDLPWRQVLKARRDDQWASCAFINVNQIVWRVRAALGLPEVTQKGARG